MINEVTTEVIVNTKRPRDKGLTVFQLKVIALVAMTLDHIGSYGFEISLIVRYEAYLKMIGRIAAPIFLFLLIQSIYHTRNKSKFLLRLYLAGMLVGLFDTSINFFFGEKFGYFTPDNIFFTFFYVALYSVFIDRLIDACKHRNFRLVLCSLCVILMSLVPSIFFNSIYNAIPSSSNMIYRFLFQGLRKSIFPSFYDVDYGIGFILLGVAFYFAKSKNRQCFVFSVFCVICIIGTFIARTNISVTMFSFYGFTATFFDFSQCYMLFSLPFMLLYNGARGKESKWMFYWYYPIHRQILRIIFMLG